MGELYDKILEYTESDFYPFHMPGHKRNVLDVDNPYFYDITEIDGFDNLHNPQGILKDKMDAAKEFYDSDKTFFLVNGSTCGIMAAISSVVKEKESVLVARNCHKSVFSAIYINNLDVQYVLPDYIERYGIDGGISPSKVEMMLDKNPEIKAVIITSPTYEGVVSDVEKIAEIAHSRNVVLIVDEAHGAHFGMHKAFPKSALSQGADIVIQSLHKTLPALTQTAIMHVKSRLVDIKKLEAMISVFETSSPSYVLLASIDACVSSLIANKELMFEGQIKMINTFLEYANSLEKIKLVGKDIVGKNSVFDFDISKLVFSTKDINMTGEDVYEILRDKHHLQLEMASVDYLIAMTSPLDNEDGIMRLFTGIMDVEGMAVYDRNGVIYRGVTSPELIEPENVITIYNALNAKKETMDLNNSIGYISAEYIYAFPPGIPIIAPGEIVKKEHIELIKTYKESGLNVICGSKDALEKIEIVSREEKITKENKREELSNKIFMIMGKSSSGKDTIYKKLLEERALNLKTITGYTTRPMRDGEENGVQYNFVNYEFMKELEDAGKILEKRCYNTVHGDWYYFTVDDGNINLSMNNYLMIGTPDSYKSIRDYFGKEVVVPIFVNVSDDDRLLRAFAREKSSDNPDYAEMCRRFLGDEKDFSDKKLRELELKKYYQNDDFARCFDEIKNDILKTIMMIGSKRS